MASPLTPSGFLSVGFPIARLWKRKEDKKEADSIGEQPLESLETKL